MEYIISLSEAEDKALHTEVLDIQDFINNFIHERCRVAMDKIIGQEVQKKLDKGEPIIGSKEEIVLAANIPSVKEQLESSI